MDSGSSERKADRVSRDLLKRIVRGTIAVGSVLPREEDLAAEFGVNRGVVREAIKLLEVHGLVKPVRRRGTVVLDPMESLSPEVLRAMLEPKPGQVDRTMLESLLEIRTLLDVQMYGLAAERCTRTHCKQLTNIVSAMRESLEDPSAFAAHAFAFQVQVARATGNPIFEMLVHWNRAIVLDLEGLFRHARPPLETELEGRSLLLEQLKSHDVEGARRVVATYYDWSNPRLVAATTRARGPELSTLLEKLR